MRSRREERFFRHSDRTVSLAPPYLLPSHYFRIAQVNDRFQHPLCTLFTRSILSRKPIIKS